MNTIDPKFAAIDVRLRSGAQVNRTDYEDYEYLCQNLEDLQRFYAVYQATLTQHPDGFFFLNAQDGLIRSRRLPHSTMHMGQFICFKSREAESTRFSSVLSKQQIVQELETSLPQDQLLRIYGPGHGRTVALSTALKQMHKSMKELERLHFVQSNGDALKPLESICRFAELARHGNEPDESGRLALEARGVVLGAEDLLEDGEDDDEAEAE